MTQVQDDPQPSRLNAARLAAAVMTVCAALLAVIALIWAIMQFWLLSGLPEPRAVVFAETIAFLLAFWSFCALLWGGAEFLRRLELLLDVMQASATAPTIVSGGRTRNEAEARLLEQLVRLTGEVRDIGLLNAGEREQRLQMEADELMRRLEQEVPALLREHNWPEAYRRVQRARLRFPSLKNWDTLEQQVEAARAGVAAQDIEAAEREMNDLITLGAFDRATQVLQDLQRRHPGNPRVEQITRQVALSRDKAAAEERARLMAQAQTATDARRWQEALQRVELMLNKYPHSPEAQELRQQLPTLRDNAEIQTRQQMESDIRDLIQARRFPDALRVAKELIERYPRSPQAEVLRDQLPRLEQRAAEAHRR